MNANVQVLRSRLRDLSTTLRGLETQRQELREQQLTQLQRAMQNRATIREAVDASGLSRAYLHRIEMHEHRGAGDDVDARTTALAQAADCRRRIEDLDDGAELRVERDQVIRTLHQELAGTEKLSRRRRAEISALLVEDSGLTGERVRMILQATDTARKMPAAAEASRVELVDALLQTVRDRQPGTKAIWMHHGVEVTVYGQAAYKMEAPTPWAVITVDGRIRAFTSWDQVIDAAEEAAASR